MSGETNSRPLADSIIPALFGGQGRTAEWLGGMGSTEVDLELVLHKSDVRAKRKLLLLLWMLKWSPVRTTLMGSCPGSPPFFPQIVSNLAPISCVTRLLKPDWLGCITHLSVLGREMIQPRLNATWSFSSDIGFISIPALLHFTAGGSFHEHLLVSYMQTAKPTQFFLLWTLRSS